MYSTSDTYTITDYMLSSGPPVQNVSSKVCVQSCGRSNGTLIEITFAVWKLRCKLVYRPRDTMHADRGANPLTAAAEILTAEEITL